MYDDIVMSKSLDELITALCADYLRRADVIATRSAPYNVIMEYRFLNYRIMNAAIEIAGTRDALSFIDDIGSGLGYAGSGLYALAERVYKERKRDVKYNIAKRLSLI